MQTSKYPYIHNSTQALVEGFLMGEHYTEALSEKIFATFDPVYATNYRERINDVKRLINQTRAKILNQEIFHIDQKNGSPMTATMQVALVRFVNLCHKGRYLIVVDEEIVFIPERHLHTKAIDLQLYVSLTLLEEEKKTASNFFNRIRSWIYGARFNVLRTVAA